MQTYISALPLMGPDTLLFKTYHTETITCRSDLQSHSPSGWVPFEAPAKWGTNSLPKAIVSSFASECHPTLKVRFYNPRTGNEVENSLGLQVPAESIHFFSDRLHVLTVDEYGTISTWNVKRGSFVHDIESKFPLILGNRIFVGGRESHNFSDKFSVWDTATTYIRVQHLILAQHRLVPRRSDTCATREKQGRYSILRRTIG